MSRLFYFTVVVLVFGSCGGGKEKEMAEDGVDQTEAVTITSYGIDESLGMPKGLQVGSKSPGFGTRDINGNSVDLYSITKTHSVVVMFYRGSWCPHCTKFMSNLADSVDLIVNRGVKVIAVTPENRDESRSFAEKFNNKVTFISDNTGALMKAFDVRFSVSEEYQKQLIESGHPLENSNGTGKNFLPVPATFVIDKSGTIVYRHFDYNYQNRVPISVILDYL